MINRISNLSFGGRMFVRETDRKGLEQALDEASRVLTTEQKDELITQLKKIKEEIKDKDIDILVGGCPSSSSIGELRIVLSQANHIDRPSVYFAPGDIGNEEKFKILGLGPVCRFGFYNENEIHKLADELLKQVSTSERLKYNYSDTYPGKVFDLDI